MTKIMIDSITIKFVVGMVIAIFTFTFILGLYGEEVEEQSLEEQIEADDYSNLNDKEGDFVGNASDPDIEQPKSNWGRIKNTISNIWDGMNTMGGQIFEAPAIIQLLFFGTIPLLVLIILVRSIELPF